MEQIIEINLEINCFLTKFDLPRFLGHVILDLLLNCERGTFSNLLFPSLQYCIINHPPFGWYNQGHETIISQAAILINWHC